MEYLTVTGCQADITLESTKASGRPTRHWTLIRRGLPELPVAATAGVAAERRAVLIEGAFGFGVGERAGLTAAR
jgi:hypothetical protein